MSDEAAPPSVSGPGETPEGAPAAEPTGDPRVDAALARLGELPGRPVPEHVEIYEDVHHRLQEILASAGDDPAAGAPRRPAFPAAPRPGGAA
ncbi:hypothetical protein [Spirillospora albida]|uniref:hypothetical protein n=1 Tax=Spirillospora albida TaxID=58123 RepID=UPI001FE1886B|nr:hypothetical protein [Spirillospora albida]